MNFDKIFGKSKNQPQETPEEREDGQIVNYLDKFDIGATFSRADIKAGKDSEYIRKLDESGKRPGIDFVLYLKQTTGERIVFIKK